MREIYLLTISFLVLISCNEPTNTTITEKLKDPREMIWTADTLQLPVLPQDMLVLSPSNIWLAVWVSPGELWHYDGKIWKTIESVGGSINCLTRVNDNNLWAGGRFGRNSKNYIAVANYKNNTWIWNEMPLEGEVTDMCTDPQGNIWACSRNGIVLKYSNNKWSADTIKQNIDLELNSYWFSSVEYYNGNIYLLGGKANKSTSIETDYFIMGDIKKWSVLDSMVFKSSNTNIKWGNRSLHISDDGKMYSCGLRGIWKYENNQWDQIKYFDGQMYGMYSPRSDYILVISAFNQMFYYNGYNWQLISDIFRTDDPYFVFRNVWTNGKEIHVTGYGRIKNKDVTIVWHGK